MPGYEELAKSRAVSGRYDAEGDVCAAQEMPSVRRSLECLEKQLIEHGEQLQETLRMGGINPDGLGHLKIPVSEAKQAREPDVAEEIIQQIESLILRVRQQIEFTEGLTQIVRRL